MLGIYIHLPFCRVHCTYCPFAISTDLALQDRYVDALLREIDARLGEEEFDTIYFGGGTPSRTSMENLTRIVERLSVGPAILPAGPLDRQDCRSYTEFTIEANPEDITTESLAAWRALGINRVSIGVQSFHDRELVPLGRIHGREGAREAVALAVASGVRTTLDLILGLPQQTAESFHETLDIAIDSGVGHLSLYMLDLEEKTPLQTQVARGRTELPEDELVALLYLEAVERLESAGLRQYEISNFARPGEESRHNLRYWTRDEYHGFGLGAHSFIGARRFANTRDIRRYIELAPDATDFSEDLGDGEVRRETIFLRLRQTSGIDYEDARRFCGQEGIEWIERGLRDGWLKQWDGRVAFTPAGFLQSNDYISQLF